MKKCISVILAFGALPVHAEEKTVFECWKNGEISIATFREPGSRCAPKTFEVGPNKSDIWKATGMHKGTLYTIDIDGKTETTTRNLPGSKAIMNFTIRENEGLTPPTDPLLAPKVFVGAPRLGVFDPYFKESARRHQVDEAWLRAIAHVESGYSPTAVSPKGAMGVMQLMPQTAQFYAVRDPFSPSQSIDAGARHMAYLLRRYQNDYTLAAAAYNAGEGAVTRYKGVPPFAETRAYVVKVNALYRAYKAALPSK